MNNNSNNMIQKWTLWEGIKITTSEYQLPKPDYNAFLLKVIDFQEEQEFLDIMHHLPHTCPSRLFTDSSTNQLRKFSLASKDGEFRQIESVCLFKEGIHPSWEDQSNVNGSSIQYDYKNIDNDIIDNIWRKMMVDLYSNELFAYSHVNGIRILEKFSPNRRIKVEFWYNKNVKEDEKFFKELQEANLEYLESLWQVDRMETKFNLHQQSKDKAEKTEKKSERIKRDIENINNNN